MSQNDRRFHSAEPAGESTGSNAGEVLKVADRGCGGCESLGIEDYNGYNLILALESDPAHQTWRETQAVSTQILGSKPVSVIFLIYTSTNTSSGIKMKNDISVEKTHPLLENITYRPSYMDVSLTCSGGQERVMLHYTSLCLFVSRLRITQQLSCIRRRNTRNSKRPDEFFTRLYVTTLGFMCSGVTSVRQCATCFPHTLQRACAALQMHQERVGVSNIFTRTSKRGLE